MLVRLRNNFLRFAKLSLCRLGEYHIDIFADDVPIDGSPFIARSFDVTKIRIDEFPPATLVGSPTHFLSKEKFHGMIGEMIGKLFS